MLLHANLVVGVLPVLLDFLLLASQPMKECIREGVRFLATSAETEKKNVPEM